MFVWNEVDFVVFSACEDAPGGLILNSKCRLLISFTNSLDPDQARQNFGPDLDPNYLTL